MSSQATSDFRRNRKEALVKMCGNKCCICGYDRVVGALEFHHIDESEKSYGLSAKGTCHDLEADIAEVRKCILVCANCHREIHANLFSREFLRDKQYFDEGVISDCIEDNRKKKGLIKKYCSKCGKEISKYGSKGLCPECSRLETRVCERPSREELKKMIRELTFVEIGKKYGVADNSIKKWCIAENLPSKKKDIKLYSNEDWEKV